MAAERERERDLPADAVRIIGALEQRISELEAQGASHGETIYELKQLLHVIKFALNQ